MVVSFKVPFEFGRHIEDLIVKMMKYLEILLKT